MKEQSQNKDATKRIQHSLNRPIFFLFPTIIGLLIILLIVIIYQSKYQFLTSHDKYAVLSVFCDATFVAGVIVGGIGGLLLISGEGLFDIIAYGVSKAFQFLFVNKEKRDNEAFIDYKLRKEGERSGGRIWFVAVVGAAFLLIALLTSIPFWNVSSKRVQKGYDTCYQVLDESVEDPFETTECEYIYIKLYQNNPQYNGTIVYAITYKVSEETKTVYYLLYLDENSVHELSQIDYLVIKGDYNDESKNFSGISGKL